MEDFTKGGIFTEKEDRLVLSAYRDVADIRSDGHVKLVQNTCSGKFFVKKVLSVYHKGIYEWLLKNPVPGMPRIYFVSEDRDTLTVIEEYLSGDTLESILGEKGKLSLKELRKPCTLQSRSAKPCRCSMLRRLPSSTGT